MTIPHEDDRITAYLDGELDELERARFEAELKRDQDLSAAYEQLKTVRSLVRRHGPVRAPKGFANAVMDAVDEAPETAQRSAWWRRPFGVPVEGLAVAAAALLVLTLALPDPPTPPPRPAAEGIDVQVGGAGDAKVYRAPKGWVVRGDEAAIRGALAGIATIDSDLQPKGSGPVTLRLTVDASQLGALQNALMKVGALEPVGPETLAVGDTTIELVLGEP